VDAILESAQEWMQVPHMDWQKRTDGSADDNSNQKEEVRPPLSPKPKARKQRKEFGVVAKAAKQRPKSRTDRQQASSRDATCTNSHPACDSSGSLHMHTCCYDTTAHPTTCCSPTAPCLRRLPSW
jgi:hypothetical protein